MVRQGKEVGGVLDDLEEKYVYQDVARESRRPSEREAMARRRRSPPLRGSWESGLVCGILCNGISGKYLLHTCDWKFGFLCKALDRLACTCA